MPSSPKFACAQRAATAATAMKATKVKAGTSAMGLPGGVAPVPLFLEETSAFLEGRPAEVGVVTQAAAIADDEIAPISDIRGTADYKRLLLRQLLFAHFERLFGSRFLCRRFFRAFLFF